MVDEDDVAELVADRPALASGIEAVLEVDDERDRWSFDDVSVDTGLFGEIVGQGLVEEDDDGYYVADPAAVRAGIVAAERSTSESDSDDGTESDGGTTTEVGDTTDREGKTATVSALAERGSAVVGRGRELGLSSVPARRALATLAVIAVFVAVRLGSRDSVFRGGDVVLMGNDPYYYRYWVETLLARSSGPLDFGVLADAPTGEPLLVATLWWVSSLLGGTADMAGLVLAWYPVVAGLVVAGLLYLLAARVFGDHRVGLVAVAVLAVTPGHAMRTALGFADHHAFDYVWLMGVVVAMAWLATVDDAGDDRSLLDRIPWAGTTALGVTVAGLVLSWNGSPVVLVPVALLLGIRTLLAGAADRSPVAANASVLAGLGLAAALSLAAHFLFGWQGLVVVLVPGLLCVGGVAVVALGVLARRRDLSIRAHAGIQVVSMVAAYGLLSVVLPAAVSEFQSQLAFLVAPRNIGETVSLFDPSRTFGVDLVGLVVLFALPMLAVGLWRGVRGETPWLVASVFGWWLVALSALQLRFVGQLAPLAAFFAAVGFVRLLVYYDLAAASWAVGGGFSDEPDNSPPNEGGHGVDATWIERDSLTVRAIIAILVVGSLLVGPAAAGVTDEVSSPEIDDRVYESATWIAGDADQRGLSPAETYVFSDWGTNRVYNYFVSGKAESYGYARANYIDFLDSGNASGWYERLHDRVDYVVLTAIPRKPNTVFEHLWVTAGSRWSERGYDAVSHYREVFVTENYNNKVFTLVPGATLAGSAAPNATVTVSTRVSVPNDSFTYRQRATAGDEGRYDLVVPYPGEYEVTVENETTTVSVSEAAVQDGGNVTVSG